MSIETQVVEHYGGSTLIDQIAAALQQQRIDIDCVSVDDLGPVDEFHIGGRTATAELVEAMGLGGDEHVLDVGSGIGGTARLIASTTRCSVTGLDLVPNFVEVARELTSWTGLEDRVDFRVGSALDIPFDDASFGASTQLHVGMNIDDKRRLFTEVRRVLRPGATFGLYDIMRLTDDSIGYPVPWATDESTSALGRRAEYEEALTYAGFDLVAVEDRRAAALSFFAEAAARTAKAGHPPHLGIHLVFGRDAPTKLANMVAAVTAGVVAPVRIIARAR